VSEETAVAIIAGLLSGAGTSVVGYLLTRRETATRLELAKEESAANIQEAEARARKTLAEAERISVDVEQARSAAAENVAGAASYAASPAVPVVVYDSRPGFELFDFRQEVEGGAEAVVTLKDGILNIERRNMDGRFFLWLESYAALRGHAKLLASRGDIEGERKLRLQCQARAIGGEHTLLLRVIAKDALPGDYLARWRERLRPSEWVPIDWYFQIPATEDCSIRIDDRSVTKAPSAVQIRNLVITERG
jgi:hypothetical protein